jgi:hypothetical protein
VVGEKLGDNDRTEHETGLAASAPELDLTFNVSHPSLHDAFIKIKDARKRAYLVALSMTPRFEMAAHIAGVSSMTGYKWRRDGDADFQEAYQLAREIAIERAESEAWRRAIDGTVEDVYGSLGSDPNTGKSVGTGIIGQKRNHSDNLMMFMLKGHRPDKYRERFEHSGPNGGPMQVQAIDPRALSTETLQRILDEAKQNQLPASTEVIEAHATEVNDSDTNAA